ncbi:hypothetical protein NQ317_017847 [Molorchus minor]|uniref:Uncharacterized protein n=1 Tax=Molorchus minor TaxID=1323400 RepID=A0ABQ9K0Q9_9CUCU|nr:hypothetical protein NQ317_017847 [Molorchus minor]
MYYYNRVIHISFINFSYGFKSIYLPSIQVGKRRGVGVRFTACNQLPPERKPNERTYLLKTLAGCPNDGYKIEKLLNITVLEQNGNFTENDIYLIFSMLTGGSNGYTSLFNFLRKKLENN